MRAIAARWREFNRYSRTSWRTRLWIAFVAAIAGLGIGLASAHASVRGPGRPAERTDATVHKNGCHYGVHRDPVGHRSQEIEITWDDCHRFIWAYAKCRQPDLSVYHAVGERRTNWGTPSTAHCARDDIFGVFESGFRYRYKKCVPNGIGTCTVVNEVGQYTMYP